MKLIRVGEPGNEKPGVLLDDGRRLDVSTEIADYNPAFFASGGLAGLREIIGKSHADAACFATDARLGPPVAAPGKLLCIGLNYREHARETGSKFPREPVIFMKATSAICGPNDPLIIPRDSEKTDWEVELAVVIGKRASYVDVEDAMHHVAGYMLHNDYSERAFQIERGGQWVKGKSADHFAPLGPFMATADEIADPQALHMWLKVNGQQVQDSSTADMIFSIAEIISSVSQYMSLMPGDVISTGTPSGVGLGMDPPVYLRAGDVVELGIDGLGSSQQQAVCWEDQQLLE